MAAQQLDGAPEEQPPQQQQQDEEELDLTNAHLPDLSSVQIAPSLTVRGRARVCACASCASFFVSAPATKPKHPFLPDL